ncbi:MAG: hypothetical protein QOI54_77 [Actinomycetota bacterium]|jgi:hypothetical protein|nr:hypothetical protein [Actinomycetota bacterium]
MGDWSYVAPGYALTAVAFAAAVLRLHRRTRADRAAAARLAALRRSRRTPPVPPP